MAETPVRQPQPPKRWISLGLLIGGHGPDDERLPPVYVPRPRPPAPPPPRDEEADERRLETMRAAGYEPNEPFPGRSAPWPSTCTDCGAPRKPTLTEAERGRRCGHSRRGRAEQDPT